MDHLTQVFRNFIPKVSSNDDNDVELNLKTIGISRVTFPEQAKLATFPPRSVSTKASMEGM